jgi:hypothetical protein
MKRPSATSSGFPKHDWRTSEYNFGVAAPRADQGKLEMHSTSDQCDVTAIDDQSAHVVPRSSNQGQT